MRRLEGSALPEIKKHLASRGFYFGGRTINNRFYETPVW